jgi:cysteine desulfurase
VSAGQPVYLDYAATTPVDPRVVEAMLPYLTSQFGNAASQHAYGSRASSAVERGRAEIADLIGGEPEDVTLTSGATESINLVLKGAMARAPENRRHLVVGATEHKAVLDSARALEAAGVRVTTVPVDARGVVSVEDLAPALSAGAWLVSLMAANNETGTLGPIEEAAAVVHEAGALLHTDATQLVGKLPVDVEALDIDFMSFSSHKMYGPMGIGALYVRRGRRAALAPQLHGGGHERGLRSGTVNVPGCVGFGLACRLAMDELVADSRRLGSLRDRLEQTILSTIAGASVNGHPTRRLPHISNLRLPGVDADSLVLAMPDVAVSSGSACTSATPTPSHVLLAMGMEYVSAGECVRFSLGRFTTTDEVDYSARRVAQVSPQLREATPQQAQGAFR